MIARIYINWILTPTEPAAPKRPASVTWVNVDLDNAWQGWAWPQLRHPLTLPSNRSKVAEALRAARLHCRRNAAYFERYRVRFKAGEEREVWK